MREQERVVQFDAECEKLCAGNKKKWVKRKIIDHMITVPWAMRIDFRYRFFTCACLRIPMVS